MTKKYNLKWLKQVFHDFKTLGVRATFKRHGRPVVILIFTYYLVRDTTLYILLPYYLLK